MANGSPSGQRRMTQALSPEEIAIARANAEDHARRELFAILQQTLVEPIRSERLYRSLATIAVEEDGTIAVYVATPDGSRVEIPLTRSRAQSLTRTLCEQFGWTVEERPKSDPADTPILEGVRLDGSP